MISTISQFFHFSYRLFTSKGYLSSSNIVPFNLIRRISPLVGLVWLLQLLQCDLFFPFCSSFFLFYSSSKWSSLYLLQLLTNFATSYTGFFIFSNILLFYSIFFLSFQFISISMCPRNVVLQPQLSCCASPVHAGGRLWKASWAVQPQKQWRAAIVPQHRWCADKSRPWNNLGASGRPWQYCPPRVPQSARCTASRLWTSSMHVLVLAIYHVQVFRNIHCIWPRGFLAITSEQEIQEACSWKLYATAQTRQPVLSDHFKK